MSDLTGKRIAIVGNGPSALANTEDIDSFDFVVRFNRFRLGAGFEMLGTRVDALALPACYSGVIDDFLKVHAGTAKFVLDLSHADDERRSRNRAALSRILPAAQFIDGHEAALRTRGELMNPALLGRNKIYPTTGISAVAWAMGTGAAEIYMTGFSFERAKTDHYFEDPRHPMRYTHHCPIKELHWLADRAHHPALKFDEHIRGKLLDGQPCNELAAAKKRRWKPYSEVHQDLYYRAAGSIVRGSCVLEIGAGIGWGATVIQRERHADLALVEPHAGCREHLTRHGWDVAPGLDEVRGQFDYATCIEVLEHLPAVEVTPFLRRVADFAPRAIFTTPCRLKTSHGRRTAMEWRFAFENAGWEVAWWEQRDWTLFFEVSRRLA